MKKNVIIDHEEQKIILCRDFDEKARNGESAEFKKLCEIIQMFPGYKVKRRTIAKKKNKEAYNGLNYEYMEKYISEYGDSLIMDEYKDLRYISQCHSVRFPVIKAWFLKKFPEVKMYGIKDPQADSVNEAV